MKIKKIMECALYVLISLVILWSMFEVGHDYYENSKQTTKIVNYWLPGQYEIVEKVPAGESVYFAQDFMAFQKAFADRKIYVCPDQEGTRYYVNLNGTIYTTYRIDYTGLKSGGLRLISVRFDQPGQARFIMERSWFVIIGGGILLGGIIGCTFGAVLAFALLVLYWVGKVIVWAFRRIFRRRTGAAIAC